MIEINSASLREIGYCDEWNDLFHRACSVYFYSISIYFTHNKIGLNLPKHI